MTSQCSEIYKIKAVLTAVIQQSIVEFCELADVSSSLMRELKLFFLYQTLDSEFYHLKKQIKIMKQSDINSEKMRSLINNHLIQIIKLSASATTILSSANLANKNKQKSGQEEQFGGQSGQSG